MRTNEQTFIHLIKKQNYGKKKSESKSETETEQVSYPGEEVLHVVCL